MRNPSDNWEELRQKVLGLGGSSVHKTHYPALKQRLDELEQTAQELKRSEAYLAEAQALSHTGSLGWKVRTEEHIWSEQTYRIFEYDPTIQLTLERIMERIHPEDRDRVRQTLKQAAESSQGFDYEHRLLMPDGRVKHLHVLAKAMPDSTGGIEFVGAVRDITAAKIADEKLRQSEAELRQMIEAIPQQVFVFDPEWNPVFANRRELEYIGLTLEEAQSTDALAGVFHEEDRKRLQEARERARCDGAPVEIEVRIRGRDGQYRWFLIRDNPLRDEQGHVLRWYGTRTDIEERKRAEEEVRNTAAQWQATFDAVQDSVLLLDKDFRILRANHASAELLGLPFDKIVGGHCYDLIHGTFAPPAECPLAKMRQSRRHEEADVLARKGGPWLSVSVNPQFDSSGELIQVVHVARDITERKRAEEALRRAEGYLVEAQRLTHTGAWATNAVPDPLYWSEELFRLYGFDPQRGFPTHDQAVQRVHPEDRDRYTQAFHRVIHQKMDSDVEFRTVLPDGTIRYLYGLGHPILNTNGDVVEVVGTTVDITERKRAEEALRESETLFRTFVDHAEDAFFMLDFEQGTIIDVNRCACEGLGYSREELIGMTPLAFDVDLDRTTLESITAQAAAGGTVMFDRHWHRRKDGSLFPVEVQTSAFRHGGRRFLLKVARDITERIRAEKAIRQSEAELQQILDAAPQHLAVLGPDRRRTYLNKAVLEYLGMTHEEGQTCDLSNLFHPDDLEQLNRKVESGFSTGSQVESEARMPRHDGAYRWFLLRYKPLHDEQGRITRWVVTATDIEERKQAEERLQHENVALREEVDKASMFEEIVGSSPALRSVLSRVAKVAPTDSTVLITGETGTGKELIARAIHKRSRRSARTFVSVNCAAIPRDLIASELFGHEKGAFTGATQRRLGRFELAEGGTIFLDEIAELPAETQVALLRVLQEREFERVGGGQPIRTDVRVIAATNRDVKAAIEAGDFRSDLFFRLNVFPIETPPLRKRKEDIPLLVEYFIDRYARKTGKSIKRVNKRSLELLQSYPWPGNIRELQNIIERSVIVCETENFSIDESWLSSQARASEQKNPIGLSEMLAAQEQETIEAALRECGGRVSGPSGAAARLGMPRSTLESKIRSFHIEKSRFKTH